MRGRATRPTAEGGCPAQRKYLTRQIPAAIQPTANPRPCLFRTSCIPRLFEPCAVAGALSARALETAKVSIGLVVDNDVCRLISHCS